MELSGGCGRENPWLDPIIEPGFPVGDVGVTQFTRNYSLPGDVKTPKNRNSYCIACKKENIFMSCYNSDQDPTHFWVKVGMVVAAVVLIGLSVAG